MWCLAGFRRKASWAAGWPSIPSCHSKRWRESRSRLAAAPTLPPRPCCVSRTSIMERALRIVSVERGYDARDFTLVAFGGAGPLHAGDLAAALRIPRVLIPQHPGVLSALGMATAPIVKDLSASVMLLVE